MFDTKSTTVFFFTLHATRFFQTLKKMTVIPVQIKAKRNSYHHRFHLNRAYIQITDEIILIPSWLSSINQNGDAGSISVEGHLETRKTREMDVN